MFSSNEENGAQQEHHSATRFARGTSLTIGKEIMSATCPTCGKRFNIFDRIAQPPTCIPCSQAGRKPPAAYTREAIRKTDLFTGGMITLGGILFGAFVLLVPAREGASPSSKIFLTGMAVVVVGKGLAMIASSKKKKDRTNRHSQRR